MVLVAAARRVGTSLFGKDRRRKDASGYASGRGAMTRKFGGKVYAKVGLFSTKAEANAVAKRHRSKGNLARVVKGGEHVRNLYQKQLGVLANGTTIIVPCGGIF